MSKSLSSIALLCGGTFCFKFVLDHFRILTFLILFFLRSFLLPDLTFPINESKEETGEADNNDDCGKISTGHLVKPGRILVSVCKKVPVLEDDDEDQAEKKLVRL